MLFSVFDDHVFPEEAVDLAWMPAHTPATAVGQAFLSNCSLMTDIDREGNLHADELAKLGAGLHRVPQALRERVQLAAKAADYVARALGVVTRAANHHPARGSSGVAAGTTSAYSRDSTAVCGWKRTVQPQAARPSGDLHSGAAVPPGLSAPARQSSRTHSAPPATWRSRRARNTRRLWPELAGRSPMRSVELRSPQRPPLPPVVLEERVASLLAAARGLCVTR